MGLEIVEFRFHGFTPVARVVSPLRGSRSCVYTSILASIVIFAFSSFEIGQPLLALSAAV